MTQVEMLQNCWIINIHNITTGAKKIRYYRAAEQATIAALEARVAALENPST